MEKKVLIKQRLDLLLCNKYLLLTTGDYINISNLLTKGQYCSLFNMCVGALSVRYFHVKNTY